MNLNLTSQCKSKRLVLIITKFWVVIRKRHGGRVACYVRNELSYNILSISPNEIENIFFEILLLTNSNPTRDASSATEIRKDRIKRKFLVLSIIDEGFALVCD